jgi:CheY-like chemotaxis protein/anti-sigma regulatory factor (Ser/Thr protein kinase)
VVLVVDDSAVDRRVAGRLAEKQLPARVVYAADGVEGLALIATESPAVVLTDLQMPRLGGLELVEEVRQQYPLVPIVLMTADGSQEIAIQALQAGAASFVPKRNLVEDLTPTLQRVLAASQVDRRRQQFLASVTDFECRLALENDHALVPVLITHLQEYLLRMGLCDQHSRTRVGVALEEALSNGMYHGNLELSSDLRQDGGNAYHQLAQKRRHLAPYCDRRLHVHVHLTRDEGRFVIRDEGPGFDTSKLPDPTDPENLLRPSGRGLLLIRTFMAEARHNDSGNEITLVYRRRVR